MFVADEWIFWIEVGAAGFIGLIVTFFVVFKSRKKQREEISSSPIATPDDAEGTAEEVKSSLPVVNQEEYTRSFFYRGLQRSRDALSKGLELVLGGKVDEDALEALEEALLTADVGVSTSMELVELLRRKSKAGHSSAELKDILKKELLSRIGDAEPLATIPEGPLVIVVVGVNGSGKTTTIGKLAHRYKKQGKEVLVAAGDTFRAGAIDQLKIWAERADVGFISSEPGADPGSVVYNALSAAKSRNADVVICDTAGRLQAQQLLMDELKKVVKVAGKVLEGAPHETLIVLDSTIGQNALLQAEGFKEAAPVSGVVLTKLDGTAKGGIVVSVRQKIGIPIKLVGLGEQIEDLRDFDAHAFVDALLDNNESTT